jgi:hypothetical protein
MNLHYASALLILLAILPARELNGENQTDAPDGFYIAALTAPGYSLNIPPSGGQREHGVTMRIREWDTFVPQHVVVANTDPILGGHLIQVTGSVRGQMLNLPGMMVVQDHVAYFGYQKPAASSSTVTFLLNSSEAADAVVAMLRRRYSLPSDSFATNSLSWAAAVQAPGEEDNWHWDQARADALLYYGNHEPDYQKSKSAALEGSEMDYERRVHDPEFLKHPPLNEWPFPNYQAGPGRPLPDFVDFYSINDRYPEYLLCEYDVDKSRYLQADEPGWFKAGLGQIRSSGSRKFPPIKWVAVAIVNRAEHKGASTFEQSYKIAAVFKASDVFDSSRSLSELVAHAEMDRQPFMYDVSQPTPGDQQRWLIVERHSVNNHVASSGIK